MSEQLSLFQDDAAEIWKPVKGYENDYAVSNTGRVCAVDREIVQMNRHGTGLMTRKMKARELHPFDNGNGYKVVGLNRDGKVKNHYVHRLVAAAFLEKPDGKDYINHKDYNRGNNHVSNLEWTTAKENTNYSAHKMRHPRLKTRPSSTGEHHISVKWRGKKKNIKYYVVSIMHEEEYFRTLDEAIKYRDEALRGWGIG